MPIGDTERDDQFVEHNIPDPEQVARHLHEERRWIGSGEVDWDNLSAEARMVGELLIQILLDWLLDEGVDLT